MQRMCHQSRELTSQRAELHHHAALVLPHNLHLNSLAALLGGSSLDIGCGVVNVWAGV